MDFSIVLQNWRSSWANLDNDYSELVWYSNNTLRREETNMTKRESMNGKNPTKYPMPKRVIADVKAGVTVVLWDDGEKTIVRAMEGEALDIYDAFCAAFCKRVYGTNSALKRELNKILVFNNEKKEE